MEQKRTPGVLSLGLYSAAHFWVDLSCAALFFHRLYASPAFSVCLLVYNFCAFALQMPLGLLVDRLNKNRLLAVAGCWLTALAWLSPLPLLTAVAAGVGNALFHLGGGIDVLNQSREKAAALGIFVSPGALGLALGKLWGRAQGLPVWPVPAGLLLAGAMLLLPGRQGGLSSGNRPVSLETPFGLWPLLPLFLVVVLRSYMGMNQAFPWGSGGWGMLLVPALALGKAAGGFLMDTAGPRRAAVGSLGLAAGLYLLSALPLPGLLAVFLFNMTMPITLWAAARILPGAKGFAFGLLTFGLFLGFLPTWLDWPGLLTGPLGPAAGALLSLGLLWLGILWCRKGGDPC